MNSNLLIAYIATVLVFMITPGPSHLLMLSNSMTCGFRKSIATALGDLSANFLQMLVASIGLAGLIQNSQQFFIVVKWAGVAYLAYLGLKLVFSKPADSVSGVVAQRSAKSLYWQGFITSAANPKAVIFFAALFPQFISPDQPLLLQFTFLSFSYLFIDGAFLCFYGKFAEWIATKMAGTFRRYLNQISGAIFIAAAVMLGLKDLDQQTK